MEAASSCIWKESSWLPQGGMICVVSMPKYFSLAGKAKLFKLYKLTRHQHRCHCNPRSPELVL